MPAPSPFAAFVILAILWAIIGSWIWAIVRLAMRLPVLPPYTPRVVPWGAGSSALALLLWLTLSASVPIGYQLAVKHRLPAAAGAGGEPRIDFKPAELMTLSAVSNASTLVLVPLVLAAMAGARPRDLGLLATGLAKQVARGMVAYPLLAPVVFGAMALAILAWPRTAHPMEKAIAQDRSPATVIMLVLASTVLAPAAEELIFRGVLLGWLTRLALAPKKPTNLVLAGGGLDELIPAVDGPPSLDPSEVGPLATDPDLNPPDTAEQYFSNPYAPPVATIEPSGSGLALLEPRTRVRPLLLANLVVSLIFAAMHGPVWPTPIPLFFLSLGLGFLYQRTGSILAPIALHMTFNGVSTLMMFLVLGNGPVPKPEPKVPVPAPAHLTIDRRNQESCCESHSRLELWRSRDRNH